MPRLRKIAAKCKDPRHPYTTIPDITLDMERRSSSQIYIFICVFIIFFASLIVWLSLR
jgi:hypothetical protein